MGPLSMSALEKAIKSLSRAFFQINQVLFDCCYNSLCLLRNFQTFSESNNESIMVVGGLVGTKFSTFSYQYLPRY